MKNENTIKIEANYLGVGADTVKAGDTVWMRSGPYGNEKIKVTIIEIDEGGQTFSYRNDLGECTGAACEISSRVRN